MRLQIEQLADDSMGQLIFVFGRQICQSAMLAPAPDQFIGIELGGIGRQVLRDNLRVFRQVRLYDFRLAVNVATIPQQVRGLPNCFLSCRKNATTSSPWTL